jgi:RNase adaptor protein for sRNA GlmZ degradation
MVKIAIVGTCASGKTSVVAALRDRGYDAYAVAQEHSEIASLWAHLSPDRVVCLETSLATVRARREDDRWPQWIYDLQVGRLSDARSHADVVIQTDHLSVEMIADEIEATLGLGKAAP